MAYAALISLENTIHRFLNHHLFSISVEEKQQTFSLLEHVSSFQVFLEEFGDKFNSLEGRMRELADEAEDILEYLMLKRVSSSSDDQHGLQLERMMGEIDLIAREVEKIKGGSTGKDVRCGASPSTRSSSSSASGPSIRKDAMVGFEDYVKDVKKRLCAEQSKLQFVPICGMGGIGKTTLAKHIYDDPLIIETFPVRVWVTVSQDYSAERILSNLLESLKDFNTGISGETSEKVYKILICRKYLIVMDDIWNREAWDVVRNVFPNNGNGSRVLLTTRLSDVASYPDTSSKIFQMELMDARQSWILFKKKVFENEECPSELENIGKEIARSCQGLPLAVVVIAGVVSTVTRNLASWLEIAENVKLAGERNQIEEILSLSYFQLPQYLRPCFVYMGSFPEDDEINVTKLIRLWLAEGFLKSPEDSDTFEVVAEKCLEELVKRNLVLVTKKKCDGRIKTCGLHDLMRDLCIRKALESNFFLNLMDKHIEKESFVDSIKNQRHLSVDSSNIRHLSSACGSSIHSIKCSRYGLVKLDFVESVRLLRVLDTEAADVEFSVPLMKLGELFHLRYLAIKYCHVSNISLSNLQNLQTLIIGREKRDKFFVGIDVYLVLEWCMPQLRHVYFYWTIIFDDPKETTCSLGSLQTVSSVSHECCTERILKKIPNLKKLKVDCSAGFHHGEAACLNDLVHLHRLESLEVYAGFRIQSRPKYYSFSFPKMLKKLVLKDLILPWNNIVVVDSLPNLKVLKLKDCTCVGGTWETTEDEFPQLEFLSIEGCQLENWITESSHFPKLKRLMLRSCSNLNEISNDIGEISTLEVIEIKGRFKKSLVKSVEEIQKEQEDLGNDILQVIIYIDDYEDEDDDDAGDSNNNSDIGDDDNDEESMMPCFMLK